MKSSVPNINETFDQDPIIDNEQMSMILDAAGDMASDMVKDLNDEFQESMNANLLLIKESLGNGDEAAMLKAIHKVTGSAGNMGFARLARYCSLIEKSDPSSLDFKKCIFNIELFYRESQDAMQKYLAKL